MMSKALSILVELSKSNVWKILETFLFSRLLFKWPSTLENYKYQTNIGKYLTLRFFQAQVIWSQGRDFEIWEPVVVVPVSVTGEKDKAQHQDGFQHDEMRVRLGLINQLEWDRLFIQHYHRTLTFSSGSWRVEGGSREDLQQLKNFLKPCYNWLPIVKMSK